MKDVIEREHNIISFVKFSDPGDETVICGYPYNFATTEQSYNRSLWENDNKSQLVKPIMMKLMVLEQG